MADVQQRSSWLLGLGLAAALVVPALCNAQTASSAAPAAAVDQAARALLPAKNKSSGTLEVATSLQWPPFDFKTADGQPDGLDIRLMRALAARLGLTPNFTDVKFPAIVPGVSTGRFDAGVDQLAETPERLKIVQYVDYYKGGLGLLVRHGVTDVTIAHLCGRTLCLTQGSSQVAVAQRISDQCVAAKDKPITLQYFPDSADTYLAVANGRGDGFLTDRAVGVYVAQRNDKLSMTQGTLAGTTSLAGIVIAKDNAELAAAFRRALEDMVRDGSYEKILDQFGVADAALTLEEVQKGGAK